ncbi:MAG: MazG nucleotide pyrophosphohydrolase domain-containing protein [bacterium]|nr:MazG nucleotide pyrophosphohydrolase domain-containing protein [bacterium]
MDFKELQEKVFQNALDYGKRNGVVIDQDFALLKLFEEAGEYMQAVLIHRKKCRPEKYLPEEESKKELEKELADVLGMVITNARMFDIDLEEALRNKNWLRD